MSGSNLALIALTMALVFFAHDLAMAGDSHGAMAMAHLSAEQHNVQASTLHEAPRSVLPGPLPEQKCASAVEAGPSRPTETHGVETVVLQCRLFYRSDVRPSFMGDWPVPGASADTLRAFLQVFLN